MTTTRNQQVGDQAAKGGILGLFFYFATKNNMDPGLIALLAPIVTSILAFVSSKIGNKEIASFFGPK